MKTSKNRNPWAERWAEKEAKIIQKNVEAEYPFARSMLDDKYDIDMRSIETHLFEVSE